MAGREDLVELHLPVVVVDPGDRVLVLRVLVELQESHRVEIAFRIEDDLSTTQPDYGGGPPPAWMPDRAVGAAQMERIGAGECPLLDEPLAHRHHFPFDLLTLGTQII